MATIREYLLVSAILLFAVVVCTGEAWTQNAPAPQYPPLRVMPKHPAPYGPSAPIAQPQMIPPGPQPQAAVPSQHPQLIPPGPQPQATIPNAQPRLIPPSPQPQVSAPNPQPQVIPPSAQAPEYKPDAVHGQPVELRPDRIKMTGLQVSPDHKRIMLRFEGAPGKHSSFVMENPFRLVLDVENTIPERVPGKISVNSDGLSEIRVGSHETKTRVALDFGSTPVPAFQINKTQTHLVISLNTPNTPIAKEPVAAVEPVQKKRAEIQTKPIPLPARTPKSGVLAVKSAGIKENLVNVEIADQLDLNRKMRLVVELDPESMSIKQANLSDAQGNIKRFELTNRESDWETLMNKPRTASGPKKELQDENVDSKKYKWGMSEPTPVSVSKKPAQNPEKDLGPFRLEMFELKRKKAEDGKLSAAAPE